jgi:hypothetical protein
VRHLRIDIDDDDLYLELKLQAARERKSMKELVVEAITKLLEERQAPPPT